MQYFPYEGRQARLPDLGCSNRVPSKRASITVYLPDYRRWDRSPPEDHHQTFEAESPETKSQPKVNNIHLQDVIQLFFFLAWITVHRLVDTNLHFLSQDVPMETFQHYN